MTLGKIERFWKTILQEFLLRSQFSSFEDARQRITIWINYYNHRRPHQGIKGLEFLRVMVILDDNEARGFMFSYDKLFGAKEPTSTDQRNAEEGKETAVARTRRLFYVTCSRAQRSLAVVVYTAEKERIVAHLSEAGWFENDEVIDMNADGISA